MRENSLIAEAKAANKLKRQLELALMSVLFLIASAGAVYAAWSNRDYLKMKTELLIEFAWPKALTAETERALKPKDTFKECASCSEMVVVPPGEFLMGSPMNVKYRESYEDPQHKVAIAKPFAVSKFEVTIDEWNACVIAGGCVHDLGAQYRGRSRHPAFNISWNDAKQYVEWLSERTGRSYRLLSEAEWEYAARAGSDKVYAWGDDIGKENANCKQCGSQWDNKGTAPVGSFPANAFGLHDMLGNVWEWVEDCYWPNYEGAPTDGTARVIANCNNHIARSGSWGSDPEWIRAANRYWEKHTMRLNNYDFGFRVARTLPLTP